MKKIINPYDKHIVYCFSNKSGCFSNKSGYFLFFFSFLAIIFKWFFHSLWDHPTGGGGRSIWGWGWGFCWDWGWGWGWGWGFGIGFGFVEEGDRTCCRVEALALAWAGWSCPAQMSVLDLGVELGGRLGVVQAGRLGDMLEVEV